MGRISWSQVQTYTQCPYKWKLNYIDNLRTFTDSIFTVYGKALHDTLQTYLTKMYSVSIKEADEIDLPNMLVDRLKWHYSEGVKNANGVHFSTQEQLTEFCIQGAKALDWFKRRRADYFSKKDWELLGVEVPIETMYKNVDVLGYIDVLMRNTNTGKMEIYEATSVGGKEQQKKINNRDNLMKQMLSSRYDDLMGDGGDGTID